MPWVNATSHTVRRKVTVAMLAGAALAPTASGVAAPGVVPARFQGLWVPGKASCESPLRVRIAADRLTFESGKDSESLGGIEMAGPGYFPPGYGGVMAVLFAEFSGEQPAMITFNVGEKRGIAQAEFAPVMPGKATPQLAKYNARIAKVDLARRFALDKVLLKHCTG